MLTNLFLRSAVRDAVTALLGRVHPSSLTSPPQIAVRFPTDPCEDFLEPKFSGCGCACVLGLVCVCVCVCV